MKRIRKTAEPMSHSMFGSGWWSRSWSNSSSFSRFRFEIWSMSWSSAWCWRSSG